MEWIIHHHTIDALSWNNHLSVYQFGFWPNHSTVSLLLKCYSWLGFEPWTSLHFTLFISWLFAKDFNTVPHERILLKLEAIGFTGKLLNWFGGFLTPHYQRVVANGSHSKWLTVKCGIPPDSVLGPLFKYIYI